ncbi:hypothetical protein ACVH9Z_23920 [Rhodococcus opacus]|uniref:hypothetical protein n=1 Tax=Rhodococcus opacus TaxID=37919 RepID=UPI001F569AD4|nr:hypothetical protein [Rhodococcus opacus]UNN04144.1 hypothetical protein MOO23_00725 [Rhodococcus opacus]
MRGLGIGISVFFGWTTNEILALFFRHASRKSASPGRSSCRRRRGGACVRVQGARNAGPFPSMRSKRASRPARSTSGCAESALAQHQPVVRAVGWRPPRRPHPVPGQQFHAHA